MAITNDYTMDAFLRRTRMGLGNDRWPSRETSSTITEIFDFMRDFDMRALEKTPSKAVNEVPIATVAGTATYTDVGDDSSKLYGIRYRTIRLRDSTTGIDSTDLDYISYDESVRVFPQWQDAEETSGTGLRGRPTRWTIVPGTPGSIRLLPVPDKVYDVRVEYEVEPALYALPGKVDWYGVDIDMDGRSEVTIDSDNGLTRKFPDRSRVIKLYFRNTNIPGVKGAGTHIVTLNGFSLDGLERTETIDVTGFEAGVDVGTSTTYFDELTYVGVPDLSALTSPLTQMSVGTGDTFDTSNIGRSVTTSSLIPLDDWAERLGPIGAAAEYFYSEGETSEGDRLKREFEENLAQYLRAVTRPPQARTHAFDSGYNTRRGRVSIFHS